MADPRAQGRLVGGDDELILETAAGETIDAVRWNRDWDAAPGVALQLDAGSMDTESNDSRTAWCAATTPFGDGDLGTPGDANRACGAGRRHGRERAAPPPDDGTPGEGDIVISEFLADPDAADDVRGEWLELTNATAVDLDLGGVILRDEGRNRVQFSSGTVLTAHGRLVVGRSNDRVSNGDASVDVAFGSGLTLNNNVSVLAPDTDDASEIFAEMVTVGTEGCPIEMGLETASLAVTQPLISFDNRGLLRDDANLSVIFISDEDDNSPEPPATYARTLVDAKGDAGWRDHGVFNASAVVGATPPATRGEPSCTSGTGDAEYGSRYVALAEQTGGLVESICNEEFSGVAGRLGLTSSGLNLQFQLSEVPVPDTVSVALYSDPDARGFLRLMEEGEDYDYDESANALVFQPDQIPSSETYVLAEYKVDANVLESP